MHSQFPCLQFLGHCFSFGPFLAVWDPQALILISKLCFFREAENIVSEPRVVDAFEMSNTQGAISVLFSDACMIPIGNKKM